MWDGFRKKKRDTGNARFVASWERELSTRGKRSMREGGNVDIVGEVEWLAAQSGNLDLYHFWGGEYSEKGKNAAMNL